MLNKEWFSSRDRRAVETILADLLSCLMVVTKPQETEASVSVNGLKTFTFFLSLRMLAAHVKDGRSHTSLVNLEDTLYEAAVSMKLKGATDYDAFVSAMSVAAANRAKGRQISRKLPHIVCHGISADFSKICLPREFSLLGNRIQVVRIGTAARRLRGMGQPGDTLSKVLKTGSQPYNVMVWVEVRAESTVDALLSTTRAITLVRSFFEYSLQWGRVTITFGQRGPRGNSRIPPPKEVYCLPVGPGGQLLRDESEYSVARSGDPVTIEAPIWRRVMKLIGRLGQEEDEDSIEALLQNAFCTYVQALDRHPQHWCFLGLWQVAEVLTLAEGHGGDTDRVVNRLMILSQGSPATKPYLDALAKKRNELVHKGRTDLVDDVDVGFMKGLCERAIQQVIQWSGRLEEKRQLDVVYSHHSHPDSQLATTVKGIQWVQSIRKNANRAST